MAAKIGSPPPPPPPGLENIKPKETKIMMGVTLPSPDAAVADADAIAKEGRKAVKKVAAINAAICCAVSCVVVLIWYLAMLVLTLRVNKDSGEGNAWLWPASITLSTLGTIAWIAACAGAAFSLLKTGYPVVYVVSTVGLPVAGLLMAAGLGLGVIAPGANSDRLFIPIAAGLSIGLAFTVVSAMCCVCDIYEVALHKDRRKKLVEAEEATTTSPLGS